MNCLDCIFVMVESDSDPDDWFNYDKAAFCKKTPRTKFPEEKEYPSDFVEFRPITVSTHPEDLRRECWAPDWCPLNMIL